jgi:hypothetical protein
LSNYLGRREGKKERWKEGREGRRERREGGRKTDTECSGKGVGFGTKNLT